MLLIAFPTIAAILSRTVMSFVDFLMVSGLGVDAQAAIVPATLVVFAVVSFGMGHMTSVSTLASQAFGRGGADRAEAGGLGGRRCGRRWPSGSRGCACGPFVGALFAAAGHTPAVEALETGYVKIALLGVFPTVAAIGLSNFFTAVQRPAYGLGTVVANVVNIGGNWLLIHGNLGVPPLGLDGAAWATTAAAFLQAAILVAWMLRPRMREAFSTWPPRGFSRPGGADADAGGAGGAAVRARVPGLLRLHRRPRLGAGDGAGGGEQHRVQVPPRSRSCRASGSHRGDGGRRREPRGRRPGPGDAPPRWRCGSRRLDRFCALLAFTAGPWIVDGVAADAEVAAPGIVLLWIGVTFQWSDAVQFVYLVPSAAPATTASPPFSPSSPPRSCCLVAAWLATKLFDAYAVHMAWVCAFLL